MKPMTCGVLVNIAEQVAPVSGCRCRGCGANAHRRPPAEIWQLYQGAAWCAECFAENHPDPKED